MADQEEQNKETENLQYEGNFAEEDPGTYEEGEKVNSNAYYQGNDAVKDPDAYYQGNVEVDPNAYYQENREEEEDDAYYQAASLVDPNAYYQEGIQVDPNAYYQGENVQDPYGYQSEEADTYGAQYQPSPTEGVVGNVLDSAVVQVEVVDDILDSTVVQAEVVDDILDSLVTQAGDRAERKASKTPEFKPQYVSPGAPHDLKICDKYFIKPGQFGVTLSGDLIPGTGEEPPNARVSALELKVHEESVISFTELVDVCSIESKEKEDEDEESEGETAFDSYDSEYLKTHIGIPLTLALAEIVAKKPSDPIHYLGHWLFKWRYNQEAKQAEIEKINEIICERERIAAVSLEKQRLDNEKHALLMAGKLDEEEEEEEEDVQEPEIGEEEVMLPMGYEEIGEEMIGGVPGEYYGEGGPELEGEEYIVSENEQNFGYQNY